MLTIRWDPVAATEHGDPGIRKDDSYVKNAMQVQGLDSDTYHMQLLKHSSRSHDSQSRGRGFKTHWLLGKKPNNV